MKWNNLIYALLFSGLGAFSYLVLVNYTDLTPRIADALYSRGAFISLLPLSMFWDIPPCISVRGLTISMRSTYAPDGKFTLSTSPSCSCICC